MAVAAVGTPPRFRVAISVAVKPMAAASDSHTPGTALFPVSWIR
jgi:hypothetical protein